MYLRVQFPQSPMSVSLQIEGHRFTSAKYRPSALSGTNTPFQFLCACTALEVDDPGIYYILLAV